MKTEEVKIEEHGYTIISGQPAGGKTSLERFPWSQADDSWRGRLRGAVLGPVIRLKWWCKRMTRKSPNEKAQR